MPLSVYQELRVVIKPVPGSLKGDFETFVISQAQNYPVLAGIQRDPSCEGGFNLPFTHEWYCELEDEPYLKYHSRRQLRFVTHDDYLTALRFKDAIKYWSVEEVKALEECIEKY
jgi:hypothetical protein